MNYDQIRDRDFYEPSERPLVEDDFLALRDVLLNTDERLDIAISQIGLDPEDLSHADKRFIVEQAGLRFDKSTKRWVER